MRRRVLSWVVCSALAGLSVCGCAAGYAQAPLAMAGAASRAEEAEGLPDTDKDGILDDVDVAGSDELHTREVLASAGQAPSSPSTPAAPGTPQVAGAATSPPLARGFTASEIAVSRGPMLIYTAQLTMAVFEVNASLSAIEELARELGGFLSRRDDRSITIRVPVAIFDGAIKRIEKIGDMVHRNVSAQDVTEEFRDLEIRLKNARAVRDRLELLLAKATKVEESVAVERELERVTGEIERMEGRKKFLRDRAAFSTITVIFEPKRQEELSQTPFRLPVPWLNQLGLARLLSL